MKLNSLLRLSNGLDELSNFLRQRRVALGPFQGFIGKRTRFVLLFEVSIHDGKIHIGCRSLGIDLHSLLEFAVARMPVRSAQRLPEPEPVKDQKELGLRQAWSVDKLAEQKVASEDLIAKLARKLIEHGVRFVCVVSGGGPGNMQWDAHGDIEENHLRKAAETDPATAPTSGDWVAVRRSGGSWLVEAVLERSGTLVRQGVAKDSHDQVLAANIDAVLICEAADQGPNVGRLERFLTLAWTSGATPVVAITKAELAGERLPEVVELVESVTTGADVHAVSAHTGLGLPELAARLRPGATWVLLVTSGAGKSSLLNALAGHAVMETGEVRDDRRGRAAAPAAPERASARPPVARTRGRRGARRSCRSARSGGRNDAGTSARSADRDRPDGHAAPAVEGSMTRGVLAAALGLGQVAPLRVTDVSPPVSQYKLVTFMPEGDFDAVARALFDAGAGVAAVGGYLVAATKRRPIRSDLDDLR